jgi:hypothetical protein
MLQPPVTSCYYNRIPEEISPYSVPLPPSDFPKVVLACATAAGKWPVSGPFCVLRSFYRVRMERAYGVRRLMFPFHRIEVPVNLVLERQRMRCKQNCVFRLSQPVSVVFP